MSKIFCIIGKSASGKNTLYQRILSKCPANLVPVIPYTTRPRRANEQNGIDYHFVTEDQLCQMERENKIVEKRKYFTTKGIWFYFTCKFTPLPEKNYISISTPEGVQHLAEHYSPAIIRVIYLMTGDRERLERCIERESLQLSPDYAEVCRRFLADQKDFSDELIAKLPNVYRIHTDRNIEECMKRWLEIYTAEN